MKILLTGATGQLGFELWRALQPLGRIVATTRDSLDLCDSPRIDAMIDSLRPDLVVNAAAFTAVDRAEVCADEAMAVNAKAVDSMARACARVDAMMVHFSTDYVFDGLLGRPYDEDVPPTPLNVYGRTKAAGDLAVRNAGCRFLVVRVGWLYSLRRRNFLLAICAQLQQGRPLRVVDDQRSAPTPAWLVADTSAHVVAALRRAPPAQQRVLLNVSCRGDTTWFGFASQILAALRGRPRLLERLGMTASGEISPVGSNEYPVAARRPKDTRLDLSRLEREFGLHAPDWQDALEWTLDGFATALPPGKAA